MRAVPLWKLKREIWRIPRQFLGFIVKNSKDLYFRPWYDLVISRKAISSRGTVDFSDEVAVYLIYPKTGVLASHLDMLDELIKAKITPVVVSNLPISQQDLKEIQNRSAVVIQRPNVGYDFGGYRDGILSLVKNIHKFKRLWLLNDSAWYIPNNLSWFDEVRLRDEDFIGASSTLTRGTLEQYQDVQAYWPYKTSHALFHYGSFALSIGPRILSDPKFLRFWRKLNITDNKELTVLRGEIGLTQWVMKRGFSHGATSNLDNLDIELKKMTIIELRSVAEKILLLDNKHLNELKEKTLCIDDEHSTERATLSAYILFSTAQLGFAYAMADYAMSHHRLQFLKKSPAWLNSDSFGNMQRIAKNLSGRIGANIRDEMDNLRV